MNSELMSLALQAAPRTMNEVARHYETRALAKAGNIPLHTADAEVKSLLRNAILLYHKGGQVTLALELCFRSQLHESLRNIADDLGKDSSPELLARCADFFMSHGQFDKAVQLQITAGNIRGALDLCMEKGVDVTEEMAERMTLPKTKDEREAAERVELLLKLAFCCEQRGNYQLAAKKYTQAGDKLKAMQALLKSGDTEKIVFFANVARQGKIYILAANYLQSLDWHNDNGEIMKSIITFYTKAKAFESLSSFYESCSQVRGPESIAGTLHLCYCSCWLHACPQRELGTAAPRECHVSPLALRCVPAAGGDRRVPRLRESSVCSARGAQVHGQGSRPGQGSAMQAAAAKDLPGRPICGSAKGRQVRS